jgi:polysaccharide export outer membrane protein
MTRTLLPGSKTAAALAITLLMATCLGVRSTAQQPEYLIGPQDVLAVTVWDQLDLSGKFTVEADGTFTLPRVGRLQAGGRTVRAVEAELKRRLADGFFKNPQVSVVVGEYRSQRIFVVGEVRQAGSYPISGGTTLVEALARAGSTTADAGREVLIVRAPPGRAASGPTLPDKAAESELLRIDLHALQRGTASQGVVLQDGDTVFVPRAEMVYVFGQVRSPGAYAIRRETTIVQVLSLAGGVTERAAVGRLRVVRVVEGRKKELKVTLGDLVHAGDTIIVPERFF